MHGHIRTRMPRHALPTFATPFGCAADWANTCNIRSRLIKSDQYRPTTYLTPSPRPMVYRSASALALSATALCVLRHCYCPLRIHTPYTTPYETRSMRALAALRMVWASVCSSNLMNTHNLRHCYCPLRIHTCVCSTALLLPAQNVCERAARDR